MMAGNRTLKNKKPQVIRTDGWGTRFLTAFREHGVVWHACEAAGVARRTVYDRKKADPKFAEQWADAEAEAVDRLEKAAHDRALAMSDTLLIFMLKCRRPEVYRDKVDHAVKGDFGIQIIHHYPAKRAEAEDGVFLIERSAPVEPSA